MSIARDLSSRLADLLSRERSALADFLVALSTFDEERRWSDLGYANLFDYLRRELGLSAGAAHYRKVAAGLVRRFPELVEPIRDGRLCFTTVVELSKVLTPENLAEVLPRFFHRSKREAMAVAAEILPEAAPRRTVVTALAPEPTLALPVTSPRALAPDPGQYRLPSGEICGSTCRLEFDHVVPLALDGESTVDQIRLLCRPPDVSPRTRDESRGRSIC